tara:strand:- start:247 stop:411 length:165 start_codon:yes stop_codon:yes gene_type:complete
MVSAAFGTRGSVTAAPIENDVVAWETPAIIAAPDTNVPTAGIRHVAAEIAPGML